MKADEPFNPDVKNTTLPIDIFRSVTYVSGMKCYLCLA